MRGAAQLLDLPQLLPYEFDGRRLPVAHPVGELGAVQIPFRVAGEHELHRGVDPPTAVLGGGDVTQRVPGRVELLRPAGRLVPQGVQLLLGRVRLLLRAVVLLGRDLRLLVQLVHLGLDLGRCQLWLGVRGPVEAGRRRRAREGDRRRRPGCVAAERALSGLAVRCHVDCTSFRTTAGGAGDCASGGGPHRGSGPPPDILRRWWPTAAPGPGGVGEPVTWWRTLNLMVTAR